MPRLTFVNYCLTQLEGKIASRDDLLSGSGIDIHRLTSEYYSVDILRIKKVFTNIVKFHRDPLLAFRLGASFKLSDLGVVGYALIRSTLKLIATSTVRKFN